MRSFHLLCVVLSFWGVVRGFYLPGIEQYGYDDAAPLEVIANKLTSPKNPLPYDYYSLPFCNSAGRKVKTKKVNLGQVLTGERAKPTEYDFKMLVNEQCKLLCVQTLNEKSAAIIKKRISDAYVVRLNLDNMPLVVKGRKPNGSIAYNFGYHVGQKNETGTGDEFFLNNYLRFKVLYHKPRDDEKKQARVVGFEVEPRSVKFELTEDKQIKDGACQTIQDAPPLLIEDSTEFAFVYDVTYEESIIEWATRWDPLLAADSEIRQIQWFSIVNSLMVGVFLTALVGVIVLRTVLKDFVR